MKPKLGTIFPAVDDGEVSELHVEKIAVSKTKRDVRILFASGISNEMIIHACKVIKKCCNLNSVSGRAVSEAHIKSKNTIVYVSADKKNSFEQEKFNTAFTGRAEATDMLYGRPIVGNSVPIRSVADDSGIVIVGGKVFAFDEREITSKKDKKYFLVKLSLTDNDDSITVKMFIKRTDDTSEYHEFAAQMSDGVKKNNLYVICRGRTKFDEYEGETVIMASDIARIDAPEIRHDNAEEKRVELHMHTKMSAMDGVSEAKDLIERAIYWGQKAVAVTDHGVVQSFPDAMKASDNNKKIKILYGMEAYMFDDSRKIIYDTEFIPDDSDNSTFVVFDTETTGLYKKRCEIIEIGAVKIKNGKIIDRYSSFVDPGVPIPENITELTGIDSTMVRGAKTIEEQLGTFRDFCEGCILVAHNADFDMGFMHEKAERMHTDFNFCYIDTLMFARCLFPELSNHKLDTITKHLGIILENHHRAVDDAKACADIFMVMMKKISEIEIKDLKELNSAFDMRSASKKGKPFHVILFAKNLTGIRNLYELVSESHLRYFIRTPRLPKSLIAEKRDGLIIGSACAAGELFNAVAHNYDEDEIEELAGFYDYLEVQPIGNNAYMKISNEFPYVRNDDDLRELNRKIIALGEKCNKPVCATCDVHFIDAECSDYRKILMYYMGFKDADNQAPLYMRTTEEMLEEFSYLGEEKAKEIVVTNTNKIADMIEDVRPIPEKKCPPVVEGAKEEIVNDSENRAREIYGEKLPEVVEDRLDRELKSIVDNGFSVMYRIAQELVRKSNKDGYLVGSRGSVGSSFVAFLSGITEVNSLPAHYICPNCKNIEFIKSDTGLSGCDLPDKICPVCGTEYRKDGHDIPFETFLGFKGNKEPDIDLNFSGDYQPDIHKYTETFFGEGFVFRAGTIGTVAEKTAYGYVLRYCEETGTKMRKAEIARLAAGCVGVKRTTGQHPGGIIVVPYTNNIHEFCPIQHPAGAKDSDIFTTHFDYHSIDKNLLKLDELGHDDPTVIRMLENLTGVDARAVPLGEKKTMSLFLTNEALGILENKDIGSQLGTYGIPEFGTKFVRQMLKDTKPKTFSELVRISGLSHGTDVWLDNAQKYIREGVCDLSHAICTRDDIMNFLISEGLEPSISFDIMEKVRKGKGLTPEFEKTMREHNIPDWYIASCKKIKYMFPKAHAVAYVTMAFRIAWFKVYYPTEFYIAYYSVRADDFDFSVMRTESIAREELKRLNEKKDDKSIKQKDEKLISILEICIEMYARGIIFENVDLYKSHAIDFRKVGDKVILPPLCALSGMGRNAAVAIAEGRNGGEFRTIADLKARTGVGNAICDILEENGCFEGIPDTDQVSIFD